VTGRTASADFPRAGTPFQNALHGMQNAFVTKVHPGGGSFDFSTYLGGATLPAGGSHFDEGRGIALDSSNNVYVTGVTGDTDFPLKNALPGSGTLQGTSDAFVSELAATGSTLSFSTYFGGTGNEDNGLLSAAANGLTGAIAADSTGNIYVTGSTNSQSGFPVKNSFQGTYGGGPADAFVAKITP
jgi:hypothetical protein